MRLAGPLTHPHHDAATWIEAVKAGRYRAANLPLKPEDPDSLVEEYLAAAREADIVISEVGAWSNPISPDPEKARGAVKYCQERLAWAERIGARCCVNIVGSRSPVKWNWPHPENFSEETFELIVQTTREIVDAVRPTRTRYTLETMPWIFPSSPDEYLALLEAIDRPDYLAVHLDPVNMVNTPARLYHNGEFIRECFAKLGPYIRSCHAKDIILREQLTVHLDECRPGTGALDYPAFLEELDNLDADIPIALEHLPAEEYPLAAEYLHHLAEKLGIRL
jgi:sugar phosphate isomerase/epimerase